MDNWKGQWTPAPKYIGECAKCGKTGLKKSMTALYIKQDSYSPLRILCHICPNCLPSLLDELEVGIPKN